MKLYFSGPATGCRRQVFGVVAGETEISHSDPGLLLFDPEIERTLRRTRQARRRTKLARLASDNNPFDWSNFDSDSDTHTTSSNIGTFTMGERLTLKQIGRASTAPGKDPIKHIKDFEVICATTRRTDGNEDAVKAFALPFSLDDRAKNWYHTLLAKVTSD
ncbi:hypothetical protein PIB30_067198 [Stylosanthes scabra]|uniref:Uncharacterized protein n=1 Tax=Stylosanthes scabra TaxID=79078 RepID=A0ABU6TPR5_9FABA|nr:hypothetical protein [Stylosanthes scabra]